MLLSLLALTAFIISPPTQAIDDDIIAAASEFLLPEGFPYRFYGAGNCSSSSITATSIIYNSTDVWNRTGCVERLEFCGTDNECHTYSCEDWYQWGPPEYTGHIHGIPIAFTTDSYPYRMYLVPQEEKEEFALSVLDCTQNHQVIGPNAYYTPSIIFGCTGYVCSGDACQPYSEEIDAEEGLAVDFRRRCDAKGVGNIYGFVCRDNGDTYNSDVPLKEDNRFRSFLQAVETGVVNCSNAYADGPKFLYSLSAEKRGSASFGGSTADYNETYARATMHSSLYERTISDGEKSGSYCIRYNRWSSISFVLAMLLKGIVAYFI